LFHSACFGSYTGRPVIFWQYFRIAFHKDEQKLRRKALQLGEQPLQGAVMPQQLGEQPLQGAVMPQQLGEQQLHAAVMPQQLGEQQLHAAVMPQQFEVQQLQAVNLLQQLQNVGLLQQMLNGGFFQQLLQQQQELQPVNHQNIVFVGPLPQPQHNDEEDDADGDLTDFQSKIWYPFVFFLFKYSFHFFPSLSFVAVFGSGMVKNQDQDKHPGSATLAMSRLLETNMG
jgi:hypothetical protein